MALFAPRRIDTGAAGRSTRPAPWARIADASPNAGRTSRASFPAGPRLRGGGCRNDATMHPGPRRPIRGWALWGKTGFLVARPSPPPLSCVPPRPQPRACRADNRSVCSTAGGAPIARGIPSVPLVPQPATPTPTGRRQGTAGTPACAFLSDFSASARAIPPAEPQRPQPAGRRAVEALNGPTRAVEPEPVLLGPVSAPPAAFHR
jgi:hypothetical protein